MAIIYSYPEIGTIAAGDLMPITDVSDTQFPTKSVTLTKLATYFTAQSVAGLDPQQLVTFDGGGLTSLAAGTAGHYMLSQGTGVYPTWNDVPWINLSQYNLPYWNGSSFTNSIIKVQPNQSLPTIEIGETGDASTKMKIFGGLEIEPAQPDFTSYKQFVVKADNIGGQSQQPKICVPSNYDRVGINTFEPNAALVVGPGDQTDGKLLGIVKQTGSNYAYMYFSNSIGSGSGVVNGIVYESNIIGVSPEQKGDRISFFTQTQLNQNYSPHFEQGKKANASGNVQYNYVAIPNIEEFEQGNIPANADSYNYIPQDGLYVDQGVVKIKHAGMETQTSIILASPNGTKYKVTVNDSGVLITTAV